MNLYPIMCFIQNYLIRPFCAFTIAACFFKFIDGIIFNRFLEPYCDYLDEGIARNQRYLMFINTYCMTFLFGSVIYGSLIFDGIPKAITLRAMESILPQSNAKYLALVYTTIAVAGVRSAGIFMSPTRAREFGYSFLFPGIINFSYIFLVLNSKFSFDTTITAEEISCLTASVFFSIFIVDLVGFLLIKSVPFGSPISRGWADVNSTFSIQGYLIVGRERLRRHSAYILDNCRQEFISYTGTFEHDDDYLEKLKATTKKKVGKKEIKVKYIGYYLKKKANEEQIQERIAAGAKVRILGRIPEREFTRFTVGDRKMILLPRPIKEHPEKSCIAYYFPNEPYLGSNLHAIFEEMWKLGKPVRRKRARKSKRKSRAGKKTKT